MKTTNTTGALLALFLLACSGDPMVFGPASADAACTPGESRACACPSGAMGAQVCEGDGSGLGPCVCAVDDAGLELDAGARRPPYVDPMDAGASPEAGPPFVEVDAGPADAGPVCEEPNPEGADVGTWTSRRFPPFTMTACDGELVNLYEEVVCGATYTVVFPLAGNRAERVDADIVERFGAYGVRALGLAVNGETAPECQNWETWYDLDRVTVVYDGRWEFRNSGWFRDGLWISYILDARGVIVSEVQGGTLHDPWWSTVRKLEELLGL